MTQRDTHRKRIREGQPIEVRMTVEERNLISGHLFDPEYTDRLRPVSGLSDWVGEYTLDDLEDWLGYIAAEANHTADRKLQRRLDKLYDRLSAIQRSYDDGLWQDSGI